MSIEKFNGKGSNIDPITTKRAELAKAREERPRFVDTERMTVKEAVVSEHSYIRFNTETGNYYSLTRGDDGGYTLLKEATAETAHVTAEEAHGLVLREDERFIFGESGARTTAVDTIFQVEV